MIISIKQENLTVAVELEEDGYEKSVSCEELLLAAYDAISRIFTQKALVKAYYNTNPDTIAILYENCSYSCRVYSSSIFSTDTSSNPRARIRALTSFLFLGEMNAKAPLSFFRFLPTIVFPYLDRPWWWTSSSTGSASLAAWTWDSCAGCWTLTLAGRNRL